MCTQRRKYLWHAANDCEETREKVREKEMQMNFKVNFLREEFFFLSVQLCVVFVCVRERYGYHRSCICESFCNPELYCQCYVVVSVHLAL